MPVARINLSKDISPEVVRIISDAVYDAMIEVASVPQHDRFQIITRHSSDELIYPKEGYLGTQYTSNIVFIQITWNVGRSLDVKKAFYRRLADDIHAKSGIRKADVWISLVEANREDWSFGNGDMQYAPE